MLFNLGEIVLFLWVSRTYCEMASTSSPEALRRIEELCQEVRAADQAVYLALEMKHQPSMDKHLQINICEETKREIVLLCQNVWNIDSEIMEALRLDNETLTSTQLLIKMSAYNSVLRDVSKCAHLHKTLVHRYCQTLVDLGLPRYFQVAVDDDFLHKCLRFTDEQKREIYNIRQIAVELWSSFHKTLGIE